LNTPASTTSSKDASQPSVEDFAAIDTGARAPAGNVGYFLAFLAFSWSAFQLYVSSFLPFWLADNYGINLIFNGSEVRVIHLAFAIALAILFFSRTA